MSRRLTGGHSLHSHVEDGTHTRTSFFAESDELNVKGGRFSPEREGGHASNSNIKGGSPLRGHVALRMTLYDRRVSILSDPSVQSRGKEEEEQRIYVDPNDSRLFMRHDTDDEESERRRHMGIQDFRFATVNQLRAVMIVLIVTLVLLVGVIGIGVWIGVAVVRPLVNDASSTLAQASALAKDARIPLLMQRLDTLSESAVLGVDYVKEGAAAFLPTSANEWQTKAASFSRIAGMVGTGLENADAMLGEAKTLAGDALDTMGYVKNVKLLENSVLLVTAVADFLRINMPAIKAANTSKAVAVAADLADAAQDLINTFRQTGVTIKLKK
jgi:hypothetical protein